ncbi:hypothetical protein LINPERHAP1_LOCUS30343 [Linum perenne]
MQHQLVNKVPQLLYYAPHKNRV